MPAFRISYHHNRTVAHKDLIAEEEVDQVAHEVRTEDIALRLTFCANAVPPTNIISRYQTKNRTEKVKTEKAFSQIQKSSPSH